MAKQKPKIVDLEMGEDGEYIAKGSKKTKNIVKRKSEYVRNRSLYVNNNSNADEFLGGVDAGLDFVESVVPRIERFFRLRG